MHSFLFRTECIYPILLFAGEVTMAMSDYDIANSIEIWGDITKSKKPREDLQEVLLSLSYLPSAERLTVVLLKARNLFLPQCKESIGKYSEQLQRVIFTLSE